MENRLMKVSDEQIALALVESRGLIKQTAQILNVSRELVYKRIQKSSDLQKVLYDAREANLDVTESKLFEAIDNNEPWAIQFHLRHLGKTRGYGDSLVLEAIAKKEPDYDLSKLSIEELKQFEALLNKADIEDA